MDIHRYEVRNITIQMRYNSNELRDIQIRQLINSLRLMPRLHLRHIPMITIGNRPPQGGGGSAHSGMPGGPYIRLNKNIFHSSWNRGPFNYTLLHEAGHIIDWAYECMRHMRRHDRPGYQAMLAHAHNGRTSGPGEHYADAYADFLTGRRLRNERLRALRESQAFRGVVPSSWVCTR